jgi:hypothetical protein
MTETPMVGGKRRIDHVLAEGFSDDLDDMETDEVRRRRDLSRGELEYLSLVRRLLQGRRDILRDELDRRRTGGPAPSVVERVVAVLAEGTRGPSRGEAPVMPLPDEEIAMARRRVERLLADSALSDLDSLGDERLKESVELMEEEERGVSDIRSKVIKVHDTLQDEMKRRLRAELSNLSS